MIREYIDELKADNKEKQSGLEKQMKELLDELDCAEKWTEALQEEKNVDKNIFSPRTMDADLESKMEEAKNNIQKIKQNIDYVKSFIEETITKDAEYDKLLKELENRKVSDLNEENYSEEKAISREESKMQHISEKFLSEIYKKTDLCLDLLYSDRSRCKNELKSMRSIIKNTMDSLITQYNS